MDRLVGVWIAAGAVVATTTTCVLRTSAPVWQLSIYSRGDCLTCKDTTTWSLKDCSSENAIAISAADMVAVAATVLAAISVPFSARTDSKRYHYTHVSFSHVLTTVSHWEKSKVLGKNASFPYYSNCDWDCFPKCARAHLKIVKKDISNRYFSLFIFSNKLLPSGDFKAVKILLTTILSSPTVEATWIFVLIQKNRALIFCNNHKIGTEGGP